MPADKIEIVDLAKLLELSGTPGMQINFIQELTINVNQSTAVSNTVVGDFTFIESLNIQPAEKAKLKSAFEQFTGTLKSLKDGSEGLKTLIEATTQYGPAATAVIAEGAKLLQQAFPL